MGTKKNKKSAMSMKATLILFALVPMIVCTIILAIGSIKISSKLLKSSTHNSMVSITNEIGTALDNTVDTNERIMQSFLEAPIIVDMLKNPEDPEIAAKAQAYTVSFFSDLDGWEGIYIADWNSQVLTHPAEAVVGRVMREGDRLKELQNAMLAANGVYNVGIIESPASGQLVISMYAPIFDEAGTPIGYVGGGPFVDQIVSHYSDVSSLSLGSAYLYMVDAMGTMLYHPDETKIGNPVENAAVKGLVAKLEKGEHPTPESVEYDYKGLMKYASYYVGEKIPYIIVLTADEKEALSGASTIIYASVIIGLICVIIGAIFAVIVAAKVAKPLTIIAKATEILSTGDVTVECDAHSNITETISIINAFESLKRALMDSMANVKNSAFALNSTIISVDGMTAENVESVTRINMAIDEVASTSQIVAENAQTMAEKAAELGMDIEQLNDNVSNLYEASLVIRSANEEATGCMRSVYNGSNESVAAMQSIADKITETNAAIEQIGSAVQTIESIASQTNLLSLNASIEAARAGEAGRGFAVVADEIRSLADSSAESARDIKQIIENVIALSNGTVEISNRVFDVISREQNDIVTTQEKFTLLSESVDSSINEINTIKSMAGRLDSIKVELANATTDLGAISEELGASAEEVAASCQTVTTACSDTQASTVEMRSINENMSTAIDFFKL